MTEVTPPPYNPNESDILDSLTEVVDLFQALRCMKTVKGLSITLEESDFSLRLTTKPKEEMLKQDRVLADIQAQQVRSSKSRG